MSAPDSLAGDGKPRAFALGGQGVRPKFGSDAPSGAGRKGFSLTGALAAAQTPSDQPPADVDEEVLPTETTVDVERVAAPMKAKKPSEAPRTARPTKAATRAPVEAGTKVLNTSIPGKLFAELDDASSAWFAANGALARRSGARKSVNTFTIAVLTLGLQAVKDSDPDDVAALFPPIKR